MALITCAADSAEATPSRVRLALMLVRNIRSPESGLAGQGVRFALAGTIVAGVYVGVTTLLHSLLAVPFQIALATGFVASVALHFTLQRLFVWRYHEQFALAMRHQALRYLLVCVTQYGITAISTSRLPDLLGLPVEVVYVITMITLAGLNFLIFRGRVFHPGADRRG
ncbi:MAG TPA: GtrA family protein [Solirubrobacteraceae bacterium]|nr:GtrA family protein [Solirubrobacteraceae bacterium]